MRRAKIVVKNEQPVEIRKVHVHHWRGDNYLSTGLKTSDRGDWECIKSGETSLQAEPTTASAKGSGGGYAGVVFDLGDDHWFSEGDNDLWFIRFEMNGDWWQIEHLTLTLHKADDGKDVTFVITSNSSSDSNGQRYITIRAEATSVTRNDIRAYWVNPEKRPLYLIAHHCNEKQEIRQSIDAGANAIECDITFELDYSRGWCVSHSKKPDSDNPSLAEWLIEAKAVADDNKDYFTTIIFDTKTPDGYKFKTPRQIGPDENRDISDLIWELWTQFKDSDMNLIISMADLKDAHHFAHLIPDLSMSSTGIEIEATSRCGIAVDFETHPQLVIEKITDLFKEGLPGQAPRFWFANGINKWMPAWMGKVETSMNEALECRNKGDLQKFYVWTYDDANAIQTQIFHNKVDGVMVEKDAIGVTRSMVTYAKNIEVRLATRQDHPFERHTGKG